MNVAEAVGAILASLGVNTAFGVVGSGNFHVTNALVAHGVRFVAARHEGGAATMADAYARMSGTVAVLSVHQGPGLTNALTGVTEAAKSRTPLLVLAPEATAPGSNFWIDQSGLASAVGALAARVGSAETVVDDTVMAFLAALLGRRTVVLNLPLDVQAAELPDEALRAVRELRAGRTGQGAGGTQEAQGRQEAQRAQKAQGAQRQAAWGLTFPRGQASGEQADEPGGPSQAVTDLAELLAAAERPVFVAGRGARGARRELEALGVVRLGLPMVIVIYDDEAYGAEVHHFGPGGFPLDTVTFPPADIARIARGFGCDTVTVRESADLAGVAEWLKGRRDRPLVVHAKVTKHGSWWLEEAFRGH